MQEIGYAKINLALHVRERRSDGYHRIETLFAFCEEGDLLSVAPADDLQLEIVGGFASSLTEVQDNLVMRAAIRLREIHGVAAGALLTLDKRLPVASGIGGGSADAAAALRLLARFWRLEEPDLDSMARDLGADVPACLRSLSIEGRGRGDELFEIEAAELSGAPILLVNPGVEISTARIFAAWDGIDRGGLAPLDVIEAFLAGRNDLQAPAISLEPSIGDVLAELGERQGVTLARMSGSGATCFALFEDKASRDLANSEIAKSHPEWWQLATRLR
jgi:4-diphosphocytidyl-2-C-methyl-D-erythritol kinase